MESDPRLALTTSVRADLLRAACDFADICSRRIAQSMADGLSVQAKADTSLVTTADTQAEAAFRDAVGARYPGHGVLGEEGGMSQPEAQFRWIVDPIDGTAEFARGIPTYGTIVGLYYQGLPLVGVIDHRDLNFRVSGAHGLGAFHNGDRVRLAPVDPLSGGATGHRIGLPSRAGFIRRGDRGHVFDAITRAYPECRTFHTCFSHACAITGSLDATVEWDVPIWDLGALETLVGEAGGSYHTVLCRHHDDGTELRSVVFGRPLVADALAELIENSLLEGASLPC